MTAKKPTKSPAKRPASKSTAAKSAPKKPSTASGKVDIYPNRMALAVATLAAVSLAVFGLIALS